MWRRPQWHLVPWSYSSRPDLVLGLTFLFSEETWMLLTLNCFQSDRLHFEPGIDCLKDELFDLNSCFFRIVLRQDLTMWQAWELWYSSACLQSTAIKGMCLHAWVCFLITSCTCVWNSSITPVPMYRDPGSSSVRRVLPAILHSPGFVPQHHIKLCIVVHAWNSSSQIVEPDQKPRVIIAST